MPYEGGELTFEDDQRQDGGGELPAVADPPLRR